MFVYAFITYWGNALCLKPIGASKVTRKSRCVAPMLVNLLDNNDVQFCNVSSNNLPRCQNHVWGPVTSIIEVYCLMDSCRHIVPSLNQQISNGSCIQTCQCLHWCVEESAVLILAKYLAVLTSAELSSLRCGESGSVELSRCVDNCWRSLGVLATRNGVDAESRGRSLGTHGSLKWVDDPSTAPS